MARKWIRVGGLAVIWVMGSILPVMASIPRTDAQIVEVLAGLSLNESQVAATLPIIRTAVNARTAHEAELTGLETERVGVGSAGQVNYRLIAKLDKLIQLKQELLLIDRERARASVGNIVGAELAEEVISRVLAPWTPAIGTGEPVASQLSRQVDALVAEAGKEAESSAGEAINKLRQALAVVDQMAKAPLAPAQTVQGGWHE